MNVATYRRLFGLLLSLAIGLAYTLVSQGINYLILPGLPLFFPPFGAGMNILLGTLLCAIIGLITAWPETVLTGVLLGSFTGALVITIANYFTGTKDPEMMGTKIIGLAIIFVPVMAMLSLVVLLLRWAMNREVAVFRESSHGQQGRRPERILFPLGLVLVSAMLGLTNLYPDLGQAAVPRMQAMLQEARQASDIESLPEPLQPPDVNGFLQKGQVAYTFRWERDDSNRYAIPRPGGQVSPSIVITNFDNGWMIVCVFTTTDRAPECRDFQQ